jgi:hypothetical protein
MFFRFIYYIYSHSPPSPFYFHRHYYFLLPSSSSSRNALGVLTTLSRREWAVVRDTIESYSTNNETSLDIVDGALFVLVIDNVAPNSISEAAANMLHGTYDLRSEEGSIEYQVSLMAYGNKKQRF